MAKTGTTTKKRGELVIDIYPPKAKRKLRRSNTVLTTSNNLFFLRRARGVAFLLMVTLNAAFINGVGTTAAYYFDNETSQNVLAAGSVDFVLEGTPWNLPAAVNLMTGTTTTRMIKVIPEADSNPFWYHASSTNFGIDLDFCATLSLNSFLEGVANYSGPLADFLSPATTTLDDWQFDITTSVNSYNKVCTFDFDFNAWQERHNLPGFQEMGYNDTETETNRVASKGFRLNKIYYDVEDASDDPPPNECPALSMGYWANNEGCSGGAGSADWNDEVNTLSTTYSSVFSGTTGPGMCEALWISNCPGDGTKADKLCKANAQLLTNEMNVVSGKLDPNAIIAGADDGNSAFDSLGLTSLSTISEALTAVEAILASATSTSSKITKASYVAERIYSFYEEENLNAPYCVYSGPSALSLSRGAEKSNEWVEVYNQTDTALDISGWSICDNTSCDTIPTIDPIPSLGYGLITASSTTAMFWNFPPTMPVAILPDGSIGNGLSNDNEMLLLKRPDGVIMDQMNYGPNPDTGWNNYNSDIWDPGAIDVAEGNTLARNPSGYDTDQPSDWVELGVPVVNLIYPGPYSSETWYWSSTYDIQWTATNPNGPDSALTIDLYLIKDIDDTETITPSDTITPIVLGTLNDGHYDFTVPSGFTGHIWIKIVVTGPENPMLNDLMTSAKIWDPIPPTLSAEEIAAALAEEEEELLDAETVGETTVDTEVLVEVVSDALETSITTEVTEETETSAAVEENVLEATAPEIGDTVDTVPTEEASSEVSPAEAVEETTEEPILEEVSAPADEGGAAVEVIETISTLDEVREENTEEIMDFDLLRREEEEPVVPISVEEGDGDEATGEAEELSIEETPVEENILEGEDGEVVVTAEETTSEAEETAVEEPAPAAEPTVEVVPEPQAPEPAVEESAPEPAPAPTPTPEPV